ncbi:copper amine oxidase N-terminal domain-containing protein [Aminipila sp.]|uniref:copper amine oxidase N-terminal domain-containing protein n=1 Tax=Aminipila sp. TaxID=2060095 RepID=UPI00289C5708|nr:copper amine oxidase N-terminal domain-containing protein [Aminipila sp.]
MGLKKQGIKRLFSIIMILALVVCSNITSSASTKEVQVSIDGNLLNITDVKPFVKDGRTMVPLRVISENLGAKVDWNYSQQKDVIKITKGDRDITLLIGNPTIIKKNFMRINMDVSPFILNGRTMVSVKFVSEALGADVEWDATKNEVKISTVMPSSTDPNSEEWDKKVQDMTCYNEVLADLYETNPKTAREFIFGLYTLANNLDKSGSVTYKNLNGAETSVFIKDNESKHDITIIQNDMQNIFYPALDTIINIIFKQEDYEKITNDLDSAFRSKLAGKGFSIKGETDKYLYTATYQENYRLEIYLDKKQK